MIRERRRHAVVANAAGSNRMEQASRVHSSYNNIPSYCLPSSSSSSSSPFPSPSPSPSPSSQITVLVLNQLACDPLTTLVVVVVVVVLLLPPAAPQDLLVKGEYNKLLRVQQLKNRWKSCCNKRGAKEEEEGRDGDEGERARGFVRASGVKERAGRQAGR